MTLTKTMHTILPALRAVNGIRPCIKAIYFYALFVMPTHAAYAQYLGVQPVPEGLKPGFEAIQINDARRILTFLATQCEGRGTGQRGFEKAARFVANEFKRLGLKPLGINGTYFQKAPIESKRAQYTFLAGSHTVPLNSANCALFIEGGSQRTEDDPETSGVETGFPLFIATQGAATADNVDFKGKIVFWNHTGETFPSDDFFARMNASKRVFVVFDNSPLFNNRNPQLLGFQGRWRLVDPRPSHSGNTQNGSNALHFGYHTTSQIEREIMRLTDTPVPPAPAKDTATFTAGKQSIRFKVKLQPCQVQTENVVGMLEGSDPKLKGEYVVVGGHLDHLGKHGNDLYPGADDDGSGATAVVEVARAMAANPYRPRRSVIFVTFFGEEVGLLGSRYFVAHPPVPLDKIVGEMQMDMVGRDSDGPQQQPEGQKETVDRAVDNVDTVRVIGSRRISTNLDARIQAMNAFIGLRLLDDAEYNFGRSDDYSFFKKGIPTAWWFTGYHADYHRPTDTVNKIDWIKLTNVAKHIYLSVHAVADADAPLQHDVGQSGSKKQ